MRTLLGKLPPLKKREGPFEGRLQKALSEVGILFVKCKPTVVGWPDRVAMGYMNTRFVEVKREGEDLEEAQKLRHAEIFEHSGERVVCVWSPDVSFAVRKIQLALRMK